MATEKDVSQVEDTEVTPEADAEQAQPEGTLPEETQPGAEQPSGTTPAAPETPPAGKTYTEAELTQITSKLQAEAAQQKQYADMLALQKQMAELQATEQQHRAKDAQLVDQGVITQEEAEQKATARAEISQLELRRQQMGAHGEQVARTIVISELVDQYQKEQGIPLNVGEFLADRTLRTPYDVQAKALTLINAHLKAQLKAATAKAEVYDKGPGAGETKTIGADRIIKAFAEGNPRVTRTDYEKAMKEKGLL